MPAEPRGALGNRAVSLPRSQTGGPRGSCLVWGKNSHRSEKYLQNYRATATTLRAGVLALGRVVWSKKGLPLEFFRNMNCQQTKHLFAGNTFFFFFCSSTFCYNAYLSISCPGTMGPVPRTSSDFPAPRVGAFLRVSPLLELPFPSDRAVLKFRSAHTGSCRPPASAEEKAPGVRGRASCRECARMLGGPEAGFQMSKCSWLSTDLRTRSSGWTPTT